MSADDWGDTLELAMGAIPDVGMRSRVRRDCFHHACGYVYTAHIAMD